MLYILPHPSASFCLFMLLFLSTMCSALSLIHVEHWEIQCIRNPFIIITEQFKIPKKKSFKTY